jgi:hypothetical protein
VIETAARPGSAPRGERSAGSWWRRLRWLGVGVRVLVPLAALWLEGVPALLGALVLQEGGLWLARRLATSADLGGGLYLGAYAVRATLAIGLHAFEKARGNASGAVFQDDATYDLVSAWLVRIGHGDGIAIFPGHKHLLDSLYPYLLAGVYAALGYAPLVPKLLNAGIAALTAVLVMELAWRAFKPAVGVAAGVGFALLPSLVLYSSVTLKEPLLLLGVMIALRAIQELGSAPVRSGTFANAGVALALGLLLVEDLRAPLVVLVGGLAIATLVRRVRRRVRVAHLALAGLVVLALAGGVAVVARVRSPESALAQATDLAYDVQLLQHRRAWEAFAARSQLTATVDPLATTAPPPESDTDTWTLADVLTPLGFALLAPAPWQAHGLRELAASAEMVLWYGLLAAAVLVPWTGPRQGWLVLSLVLYGAVTWVALAVSEGNLGNLLRHRMMLTPTLLALGAAGLVWAWERRPVVTRG